MGLINFSPFPGGSGAEENGGMEYRGRKISERS